VRSHTETGINREAWHPLPDVNHPAALYRPAAANYGERWRAQRIIDLHPQRAIGYYSPLVPAVNSDNNDTADSTLLPPLTQVPLASFVPWNLRAQQTGAERSLARLAGGYIPLPATAAAAQPGDARVSIAERYSSFEDYLGQYEAATDTLIAEGYLLPGFKADLMGIAAENRELFVAP
jgi:hypothetical protein